MASTTLPSLKSLVCGGVPLVLPYLPWVVCFLSFFTTGKKRVSLSLSNWARRTGLVRSALVKKEFNKKELHVGSKKKDEPPLAANERGLPFRAIELVRPHANPEG